MRLTLNQAKTVVAGTLYAVPLFGVLFGAAAYNPLFGFFGGSIYVLWAILAVPAMWDKDFWLPRLFRIHDPDTAIVVPDKEPDCIEQRTYRQGVMVRRGY